MKPDSNRDGKGKSGWGFASMELADEIICTSMNHTNGETVRCAENNQQRGGKERKKKDEGWDQRPGAGSTKRI